MLALTRLFAVFILLTQIIVCLPNSACANSFQTTPHNCCDEAKGNDCCSHKGANLTCDCGQNVAKETTYNSEAKFKLELVFIKIASIVTEAPHAPLIKYSDTLSRYFLIQEVQKQFCKWNK